MKPRILVAFDFSPAAIRALTWAGQLHAALGGALKVLHVLETLPATVGVSVLPLPMPSVVDITQVEASVLDATGRLAPGAAIEVQLGSAMSTAILAAAKIWSADLIAMGTHGRGGVARLVLGSVADEVLRHSLCPVITFREPA